MKKKKYWPQLSSRLKRLINRYGEAKSAYDFKGGKMPDEWPEIDKEFDLAKEALAKELLKSGTKVQ